MSTARHIIDNYEGSGPDELYVAKTSTTSGVPTLDDVTEEHVQLFHEQGFLVIEQAFDATQVDAGINGLLRLIAGDDPSFTGVQFERSAQDRIDQLSAEERQDYVRKLMRFISYDDGLNALAMDDALLRVLKKIVGGEPEMFQDMALLKPPHVGREKPWHQDKAFFDLPIDANVCGVWIALDEAVPENGCMHIIPGSHTRGPVVHFKRRDWQICDTDVAVGEVVAVPLKPGGALLFDGLLHHGTPPSRSAKRRRAVQYHYKSRDVAWAAPELRLSIFGEEGKDVEC